MPEEAVAGHQNGADVHRLKTPFSGTLGGWRVSRTTKTKTAKKAKEINQCNSNQCAWFWLLAVSEKAQVRLRKMGKRENTFWSPDNAGSSISRVR